MTEAVTRPTPRTGGPRRNWVRASILAGFIATVAMTATLAGAYLLATAWGDPAGGQLARWLANLSANRITDRVGDAFTVGLVLHLVIGLAWALLYARFVAPALPWPGIVKGILFALLPFVLSVTVAFPLMGAGVLGRALDAGPLPVLGNLVVHLVYGAVLGVVYALDAERGIPDRAEDRRANITAERGSATGVVIGGVIGAIGGWVVAPTLAELADRPVIVLAGALAGAAIGMLIGSFLGMQADNDEGAQRG